MVIETACSLFGTDGYDDNNNVNYNSNNSELSSVCVSSITI
jgi:hypothetical protein